MRFVLFGILIIFVAAACWLLTTAALHEFGLVGIALAWPVSYFAGRGAGEWGLQLWP